VDPKEGCSPKFREVAGYSIAALAQKSGLSERQIGKIESDKPPATIFVTTLNTFTKLLGCTREDLATLVERKPTAAPVDAKPARRRAPSYKPRTLEELAEMEREARLGGEVLSPRVETADGTFEMLGAERAVECATQYGAFEGQRFLIEGMIQQHKPLSAETAKVLGTQSGVGGRFQLSREIFYGILFTVTVLTPTADLTRHLIDLHRERQPANVIVRVLVARPKNKWRGFVGLETDARPAPFAFVVEKAIDIVEGASAKLRPNQSKSLC
jgi:transcriptional regulator with XRE-family HTH domain